MKKNIKGLIIICIIMIAAFLRLYKLSEIPPGVNRDEASIGYTAYSLIKTGKDEYGRSLPFSFQSFGDWKLPVYIYATVPFVKLLGLNELAVRLPSAIAGIATIPLTYVLVQELFHASLFVYPISLIAMLSLAVSPWHLHLSRVESESNVSVFFMTLGLVLFLRALKNNSNLFIPSFIIWGLTYATYHGNHVFTTLFVIGILFIYRQRVLKNIYLQLGAGIFILITVLVLSQTFFQADKTKLSGISIFGNPNIIYEKIEIPRNRYPDPQSLLVRLRYNRVTYAITTITQNYASSFSPQFLFFRGGTNHAHNIKDFGNLYLLEAPFLLLGILFLVKYKKFPYHKLLLWWILVSPVAASITKDAPHTNRMFAIFPLPPILSAIGIMQFLTYISHYHRNLAKLTIVILTLLFMGNIAKYFNLYFIQFPKNEAQYWGYGYKQLVSLLYGSQHVHKKVVMSLPETSPYIFLLFYSQFDPSEYQKSVVRYPPTDDAFVHVKQFDRFTFRPIDWESDSKQSDLVLVDDPKQVPDFIKSGNYHTTAITLPSGMQQFFVVRFNSLDSY